MTDLTTFPAASGALLLLLKTLRRRKAALNKTTRLQVCSSTGLVIAEFPRPCGSPHAYPDNSSDISAVKDSRVQTVQAKEIEPELDEDGLEVIDITQIWEEKFRQTLAPWDFGGDGEW